MEILTILNEIKQILDPVLKGIIYVFPFWIAVYILGIYYLEKKL